MGYSIYYKQVGETPTEGQWGEIEAAAHQVCDKYAGVLCYESNVPNEAPYISESLIRFNGKGNDGHETFLLQRNFQGFNFCKTAGKPYTAAVKELLEQVNKIVPGWLKLSADDNWMK